MTNNEIKYVIVFPFLVWTIKPEHTQKYDWRFYFLYIYFYFIFVEYQQSLIVKYSNANASITSKQADRKE